MRRVDCIRAHRMIEIQPGLMLCECSASGRLASHSGVADAARALVEQQGGFTVLRNRVDLAEQQRAQERREARSGYARPA